MSKMHHLIRGASAMSANNLYQNIGSGIPAQIPTGSLIHADFVNGLYHDGSTDPVTLATLFTGFSPTPDVGIQITFAGANRPKANAHFLSIVNAQLPNGFTIVQEFEWTSPSDLGSDNGGPLCAFGPDDNPSNWTSVAYWTEALERVDDNHLISSYDNNLMTVGGTADYFNTLTYSRVATTFFRPLTSTAECAISVNGSVNSASNVDEQSYDLDSELGTPGIGGMYFWALAGYSWYCDECVAKKLTIFPAQDPADLPTISSTGFLP